MIEIWLIFLLSVMIIASIVAIEVKNMLSAIITIGIVGLGTSLAFLFMQAPDLAIVQFLFEIFAIVILVRAFIRPENHEKEKSGINKFLVVCTVVVLLLITWSSLDLLKALPAFGEPKMDTAQYYVQNGNGARETGSANIVTSIILDYRAYDTLGEVTVLFTAILGALTILRIKSNRGKGEEVTHE
ncbi:MAG: hydrogen gas-evolving membrane-bound hydrogenase subunit E [Fidelibacterota bacterium]